MCVAGGDASSYQKRFYYYLSGQYCLANTEVAQVHLLPSCLFLFPFPVCLRPTIQQHVTPLSKFDSLSTAGLREKAGIRCLGALCYLGSWTVVNVDLVSWQLLQVASSPVFPSWQRMVITSWAQSAGMQQPNKQNRPTVEGICCALGMIWMQGVFSISHSSDSWDFLFSVGGKGKADYTVTQRVPVCTWLCRFQLVSCACTCVHAYFCKVLR